MQSKPLLPHFKLILRKIFKVVLTEQWSVRSDQQLLERQSLSSYAAALTDERLAAFDAYLMFCTNRWTLTCAISHNNASVAALKFANVGAPQRQTENEKKVQYIPSNAINGPT